eukprot:6433189-Lingulodinium_polyedra.AAC.1
MFLCLAMMMRLAMMMMMMTMMSQQDPATKQQRSAGSDSTTNARERNMQRNAQLPRGKDTLNTNATLVPPGVR